MTILLPENIAIHWNINGEAKIYGNKWFIIFLTLAPIILVYLCQHMINTNKIMLKQANIAKAPRIVRSTLSVFILAMVFVFFKNINIDVPVWIVVAATVIYSGYIVFLQTEK
jgi:hypothetical protein